MLVTFGLIGIEVSVGSSHSPSTVPKLFVSFVFLLSVVLP